MLPLVICGSSIHHLTAAVHRSVFFSPSPLAHRAIRVTLNVGHACCRPQLDERPMKKTVCLIPILASLCALAPVANASEAAPLDLSVKAVSNPHNIYAGVGIFSLYNVGYSYAFTPKFSLRGEYGGGLNYETRGEYDGVNADAKLNFKSSGLYADWHPWGGSFRLVGGVTFNDAKFQVNALGTGTSSINGKTVNMAGQTYNVTVKMPDTMPYIGIGTGHAPTSAKGLGMYFDFGFLIGKPEVTSQTSLVGQQGVTQADIDAQDQKIRDTTDKIGVIPKIQVGINYRF